MEDLVFQVLVTVKKRVNQLCLSSSTFWYVHHLLLHVCRQFSVQNTDFTCRRRTRFLPIEFLHLANHRVRLEAEDVSRTLRILNHKTVSMTVLIKEFNDHSAMDMNFSASTPSTAATTHHPTPNYGKLAIYSRTRFVKN